MDNTPIPLQAPTLDEGSLTLAREFFNAPVGQRILQMLRHARPSVSTGKYDLRRTQLEKRLGWEDAYDYLLQILKPKTQQ